MCRLSIHNSNDAKNINRPSLWTVIGFCLAVLILCEAALRITSLRLGPARTSTDSEVDYKRILAWRLAARDKKAHVLIVGNSTAAGGVVPKIVMDELGGRVNVFNGALSGYDYTIHKPVCDRFYIPVLHPEVVVLCAVMMDFNVNEAAFLEMGRALEKSEAWALLMDKPTSDPQIILYRVSALFRYGVNFQRWLHYVLRQSNSKGPQDPLGSEEYLGKVVGPGEPVREIILKHLQQFKIGGQSRSALFEMAKTLQNQGIGILVVNLPLSPKLWRLLGERFSEDYSRYIQDLRTECARAGIKILDLHEELHLEEKVFYEEYHTNHTGNERISRAIGQELKNMVILKVNRDQ